MHSAGAHIALAQLTDGGESYRKRLDLVEREGRLDYRVAEDAKKINREEQKVPKQMTATRLRDELKRRGLYERNQPRWALVIALEEVVRQESRILRLSQAATQTLISPSRQNFVKVQKVVSETKKKYRDSRVRNRAAKEQTAAQEKRAKVARRSVFLSLPQLDQEWDSVPWDEINDGIFVLDVDRKSVIGNTVPLKLKIDDVFLSMSDRLYEMLWRKEERGEVIWIKGKTYAYLSRRLEKLPIIPREDDSLAKKLSGIPLEEHWWKRTWRKQLPENASVFTNSVSKIKSCMKSNSFELYVLAEIILQSNPSILWIWGLHSVDARKKIRMRLKQRLVGDLDYGNNQRDKDRAEAAVAEAERERLMLEKVQGASGKSQDKTTLRGAEAKKADRGECSKVEEHLQKPPPPPPPRLSAHNGKK